MFIVSTFAKYVKERDLLGILSINSFSNFSEQDCWSYLSAAKFLGSKFDKDLLTDFFHKERITKFSFDFWNHIIECETNQSQVTESFALLVSQLVYIPNNVFIRAEAFFQLGHISLLMDKATEAEQYFLIAKSSFDKIDFSTHSWWCDLNLLLIYRSIGNKIQFSKTLSKLQKSVENIPTNSRPRSLWVLGVVLVSNNKFRLGLNYYLEALSLKKNRKSFDKEYSGLLIDLIFLSYVSDEKNKFEEYKVELTLIKDIDREAKAILKMMDEIYAKHFEIENSVQELLHKILELQVKNFSKLLLVEFFLEKIYKEDNVFLLHFLSRSFMKSKLGSLAPTGLVDINFYFVYSAGVLEKYNDFFLYLDKLEKFQNGFVPEERLKLIRAMKLIKSTPEKITSLVVDLTHQGFWVRKKFVNLRSKPKIFKFLLILASDRKPKSFEEIYNELEEDKHFSESRRKSFESIISRTRLLLPSTGIIIVNKEKIYLNPMCKVRVIDKDSNVDIHSKQRQEKILKIITKNALPISVSEILQRLSMSRRTLQMDLKQLVQNGHLHIVGKGPSTKYVLK